MAKAPGRKERFLLKLLSMATVHTILGSLQRQFGPALRRVEIGCTGAGDFPNYQARLDDGRIVPFLGRSQKAPRVSSWAPENLITVWESSN